MPGSRRVRAILGALAGVLFAATAAGLVALWPSPGELPERLETVDVGAGSLKAAADARFSPTNARVQHFDDHWLHNGNHWKHLQPEETLKAGLTAAISAAKAG